MTAINELRRMLRVTEEPSVLLALGDRSMRISTKLLLQALEPPPPPKKAKKK